MLFVHWRELFPTLLLFTQKLYRVLTVLTTLARAGTLHSIIHIQVTVCPITKVVIKQLNTRVVEQTAAFLSLFIPPSSASHHNDQFRKRQDAKVYFYPHLDLEPCSSSSGTACSFD